MAVSSEVEIMNSALRKCGAERINAANDENARARLVKASYPVVRDKLLRSHPWNFAISYVELAAVSPTPDYIYDYTNVFQLPSDCLRVLGVSIEDDTWEEIEGRRIACDSSVLKVKYIKKITDVTKYDDNFCEVLAWEVAEDIVYALTKSTAQLQEVKKGKTNAIREARSFDAQVGSVKAVEASSWLNSRRY